MATPFEISTEAAVELLKGALESKELTLSSEIAIEQAGELGDAFEVLFKKIKDAQMS